MSTALWNPIAIGTLPLPRPGVVSSAPMADSPPPIADPSPPKAESVHTKELINVPRLLSIIGFLGIALAGGYVYFLVPLQIKSSIDEKLGPMEGRLTTIQVKGDTSEQRLHRIETALDALLKASLNSETLNELLKKSVESEDPNKLRATLPVMEAALRNAAARGVILQPQQIADIAGPLVDKSFRVPAAVKPAMWTTVLIFGEYRSFVNSEVFPVNARQGKPPEGGLVMQNNLVIGGTVELDNRHIDTDVYVNATVVYRGGPLSLKNVRFDRCRFQVVANEQGAKFMKALFLATGPTVDL